MYEIDLVELHVDDVQMTPTCSGGRNIVRASTELAHRNRVLFFFAARRVNDRVVIELAVHDVSSTSHQCQVGEPVG
jgi:hypothetical protein